ncbi:MAG: hypothetical protein RBR05_01640 [Candidatus Methanomethylophilaceae archaeon]|nr:hypothetical protein [Candidatus Methanomethylophilaceae archaeon]MDY0224086.1 hypothetical protein [Candidatus Methanomethylophilaceae archaeon]
MWKILGKDAIYIDIPHTAKDRLLELAGNSEKDNTFKDLLNESELTFILNGETEFCSFIVKVSDDLTPEQIQLMADVVLDIVNKFQEPFVTAENVEQRYLVIITNNKEPELLGINKTPGMSSGKIFKPIFEALDKPGRMNSEFM